MGRKMSGAEAMADQIKPKDVVEELIEFTPPQRHGSSE